MRSFTKKKTSSKKHKKQIKGGMPPPTYGNNASLYKFPSSSSSSQPSVYPFQSSSSQPSVYPFLPSSSQSSSSQPSVYPFQSSSKNSFKTLHSNIMKPLNEFDKEIYESKDSKENIIKSLGFEYEIGCMIPVYMNNDKLEALQLQSKRIKINPPNELENNYEFFITADTPDSPGMYPNILFQQENIIEKQTNPDNLYEEIEIVKIPNKISLSINSKEYDIIIPNENKRKYFIENEGNYEQKINEDTLNDYFEYAEFIFTMKKLPGNCTMNKIELYNTYLKQFIRDYFTENYDININNNTNVSIEDYSGNKENINYYNNFFYEGKQPIQKTGFFIMFPNNNRTDIPIFLIDINILISETAELYRETTNPKIKEKIFVLYNTFLKSDKEDRGVTREVYKNILNDKKSFFELLSELVNTQITVGIELDNVYNFFKKYNNIIREEFINDTLNYIEEIVKKDPIRRIISQYGSYIENWIILKLFYIKQERLYFNHAKQNRIDEGCIALERRKRDEKEWLKSVYKYKNSKYVDREGKFNKKLYEDDNKLLDTLYNKSLDIDEKINTIKTKKEKERLQGDKDNIAIQYNKITDDIHDYNEAFKYLEDNYDPNVYMYSPEKGRYLGSVEEDAYEYKYRNFNGGSRKGYLISCKDISNIQIRHSLFKILKKILPDKRNRDTFINELENIFSQISDDILLVIINDLKQYINIPQKFYEYDNKKEKYILKTDLEGIDTDIQEEVNYNIFNPFGELTKYRIKAYDFKFNDQNSDVNNTVLFEIRIAPYLLNEINKNYSIKYFLNELYRINKLDYIKKGDSNYKILNDANKYVNLLSKKGIESPSISTIRTLIENINGKRKREDIEEDIEISKKRKLQQPSTNTIKMKGYGIQQKRYISRNKSKIRKHSYKKISRKNKKYSRKKSIQKKKSKLKSLLKKRISKNSRRKN